MLAGGLVCLTPVKQGIQLGFKHLSRGVAGQEVNDADVIPELPFRVLIAIMSLLLALVVEEAHEVRQNEIISSDHDLLLVTAIRLGHFLLEKLPKAEGVLIFLLIF